MMPRSATELKRNKSVRLLLAEQGIDNPEEAILRKVQNLINRFVSAPGMEKKPPFTMKLLASFHGIKMSDDPPLSSKDAELAPIADGQVFELRLSPKMPAVRQRFSIGHEIGHTFFPDCAKTVRFRCDPNHSRFNQKNPVEYLCDVAASHLTLPSPWFDRQVDGASASPKLIQSACKKFKSSREATLHRLVKLAPTQAAVVFLSFKLKPVETRALSGPSLFPSYTAEAAKNAKTLRVDYSVRSPTFSEFIIRDKSVDKSSLIWKAAESNEPQEGIEQVAFIKSPSVSRVVVIPLLAIENTSDQLETNRVAAWVEPIPDADSDQVKARRQDVRTPR